MAHHQQVENAFDTVAKHCFISSPIYHQTGYAKNHPLGIGRIGPVVSMCRNLGWLDEKSKGQLIDSPRADFDTLTRFHDRDYVQALIDSTDDEWK